MDARSGGTAAAREGSGGWEEGTPATRRKIDRGEAASATELDWERTRGREREREGKRTMKRGKRERERERDAVIEKRRERGPSGEAPPSAGVCICARWRRSVGRSVGRCLRRGCTHVLHTPVQRRVSRATLAPTTRYFGSVRTSSRDTTRVRETRSVDEERERERKSGRGREEI